MTKMVPAYRSRSLQMTIFWRYKESWSEREREENNIWGEEKRVRNADGLGERRRKHSPGHIKDKKKKTNRKTCLTWRRWFLWRQTMAACGLARPNRPVWAPAPARVTAVRSSIGGLPLWEKSLKGTSFTATKGPFCFLLLAFAPLIYLLGAGWAGHGGVGKQRCCLPMAEMERGSLRTHCLKSHIFESKWMLPASFVVMRV